jgi:hypothetical protein
MIIQYINREGNMVLSIPMRLVIRMVVISLGGRIWKFEMSMCVNDMEKGAIVSLHVEHP